MSYVEGGFCGHPSNRHFFFSVYISFTFFLAFIFIFFFGSVIPVIVGESRCLIQPISFLVVRRSYEYEPSILPQYSFSIQQCASANIRTWGRPPKKEVLWFEHSRSGNSAYSLEVRETFIRVCSGHITLSSFLGEMNFSTPPQHTNSIHCHGSPLLSLLLAAHTLLPGSICRMPIANKSPRAVDLSNAPWCHLRCGVLDDLREHRPHGSNINIHCHRM